MSKKELKTYLKELNKVQIEEQLIDLYERFLEVKVFYDFVFNPQEDKLLQTAKTKVYQEYFPDNSKKRYRRKAKTRRSVAHKIIKHFKTLGVDPIVVADFMFYNIEIAQLYNSENNIKSVAFYSSMCKSYREAIVFICSEGLKQNFNSRAEQILQQSKRLRWPNYFEMEDIYDTLH